MEQYLIDIEYAATSIIKSIWVEKEAIEALDKELVQLIRLADDKYNRAENLQQSEDNDDFMMGVGLMWDAYFTEDKEAYHKDKELEKIKQTIFTHEFAINSLAAALLQFAKQGISIVHNGLGACPEGRFVGTQILKNIIWYSRNQALHFEEGKFSQPVKDCFEKLEAEVNPEFGKFRHSNMAFGIIELLNWRTFENFKNDLLSLA